MTFDKNAFARMGFSDAEINRAITKVNQLQTAITQAFNPKIGSLDLSKLNASLRTHHTSLQGIAKEWQSMGARGATAVSSLSNALLSMNNNAVTVNTTLSKMANTFGNTVRWGITATIFQEMMSSIQGAVSYMRDLDDSLTQIQMVTNSSKENMRELAQYANQAAQALGSTTTDYTNAVKVFVQEGFSEAEAKQYANLSTKLANVSEQDTATTSDQITAYRNAFQLDYQQTVEAMDKVANVANNTASNVDELMTASQRSASVAQAVGASQESFLASLATIQSVTRQTAEEIGNGMKTIYQRFADIKVDGETEDGVGYGKYAKTLQSVGVDVLDAAGEFKGMDQIFKELMEVWSGLSDTMKIAVGETVAGKFQYNRFAALMNNADYYEKSLGATQNASGMMDQMNEYYIQGIEGRLKTLQAAGEQVMSTLFNQDNIEPVIENVTKLVNSLNEIVDAAGGLSGVLTALSAVMLKTFSSQIASSVTNIATGFSKMFANTRNANNFQNVAMQLGLTEYSGSSLPGQLVSGIAENYSGLSPDTQAKIKELSEQLVQVEQNKRKVLEDQRGIYQDIALRADGELQDRRAITQAYVEEFKAAKKTSTGTEEERKNIERLKIEIQKAAAEYIKLKEVQKTADNAVDMSINGILIGENENDTLLSTLESHRSELANMGIEFKDLEAHADAAGMALNSFGNAADTVKDRVKDFDLEATINRFTRLSGNITSIVFGAQMAAESFRVWGDESATLEEKLSTTFTSGLMAITMLLPAIADVIKMYKAGELASLRWAAAERIRAIASAIANAAAANPVVLVALAAVAAVIGGLVVLYQSLSAEANAANAEFEKQKDILATVKKSASDAGESLESLHKSIESIGNAKESLEGMTKGTDEWREAVRQLNREVLTLIETYPELAASVENTNGVLSISDKELDKFYNSKIQETARLQDMAQVQQVVTLESENDKRIADFGRKWEISTDAIRAALDKNSTTLDQSLIKNQSQTDEINSAFANLKNTIDTNNTTIEAVNDTIGTFNNSFTNYANSDVSKEDIEAQKENIKNDYGQNYLYTDESGNIRSGKSLSLHFDTIANDEALRKEVSEATGQTIISGRDSSWFNRDITFKTNTGEEKTYTQDELMQILADYRAVKEKEKQIIEDNTEIYKVFGGILNETTGEIKNAKGEIVTDISDLMTADNIQGFIHENSFGLQSANSVSDIQDYFNTELNLSISEESAQKIRDSIQDKINNDPLNLSKFKLGSDFTASDTAIADNERFGADVYNSLQTYDTDGTATSFLNNYTTESYAKASEKLTKVLGEEADAFELLQEKTLNSQLAMTQMEQAQQDLNLAIDSMNLDAQADRLDLVNQRIQEFNSLEDLGIDETETLAALEIDTTIDYNGDEFTNIDDVLAQISDSIHEIEQEEFSVRMSVNAEGMDVAEDVINSLGNATEAAMAINDDYTVSFENIEAVASAFPGILGENGQAYEVYADGSIQLNKDIADAAMASANSDRESTVQAQIDKLDAIIAYDDALIAEYDAQIEAGRQLAEKNELNEQDYNDFVVASRQHLQEVDQQYNQNMVDNAEESSGGQKSVVEQFAAGVINAFTSIGNLAGAIWNLVFGGGSPDDVAAAAQGVLDAITGANNAPIDSGVTISPRDKLDKYVGDLISQREGISVQRNQAIAQRAKLQSALQNSIVAQDIPNRSAILNPDSGSSSKNSNEPKEEAIKVIEAAEGSSSEWDYLTDITNDLERAAAAMEKLAKLEDRLYGKNRITQIQKLQGEYKNYIGLLQQEVALAKNHANILRTRAYDENGNLTMNAYAGRGGVGWLRFDAQGNLENGREIELALLDKVNQAVANYNANRYNEDENVVNWYKDQIDSAQANYDGFLKSMQEYQDTLGKIEDSESQIQEYKEKIQDAADQIVDAIQEGIDDMLDAMESDREFNRLYSNWFQGGNGYSHFRNDMNYYRQGLSDLMSPSISGSSIIDTQLSSLQDRIDEFKDVFDNNMNNADDERYSEEAAYENLREATDNLTDSINKAVEYYDSLIETIGNASGKMDEMIDDRVGQYKNIRSYLDNRMDQIKLLFGDDYSAQSRMYSQKVSTGISELVTINKSIEAKQATVKALESIEASGKELSTEEREELKAARDKVNELQEEQISTETALLQDVAAKLEADVKTTTTNMVNSMFGGSDVDWLSEQWELAARNSEQYYDNYNRSFEIQKLQVQYQNLLNDTQSTSLATQQKISNQMNQQLDYLRNKTKLSEYDVQYAQAQLNILQKQIALEEARNNKSQMRLQRNTAGNYDFVYAADKDSVNEATQSLLDAQQEAYNLSKNAYLNVYEGALNAAQRAKSMIVEIATDATLSTEERTERIKWILDNLKEYMDESSIQLGEIAVNLYDDVAAAENLLQEENLGNLANTFEAMETGSFNVLEHIDDRFSLSVLNTLGSVEQINTAVNQAFRELENNLDDYEKKTDTVLRACGDSYDTFVHDSIDYAIDRTKDLDSSLNQFTDDMRTLNTVISQCSAQISTWGKQIGSTLSDAKTYINYANNLEKREAEKKAAAAKAATKSASSAPIQYVAAPSSPIQYSSSSFDEGSSGGSGGGWGVGSWVGFHGWYHEDSWGGGASGNWYEGQPGAVRISSFSGSSVGGSQSGATGEYDVHLEDANGGWLGWVKYSQLFDTGGYTGSWIDGGIGSKKGKLAVLHQKELVLNEADTKNMLSAVSVVRDIMSGLGATANLNSNFSCQSLGDTIEQRVEVNASFPGVQDAIEIKQALEQLADSAYQYSEHYKI